MKLTCPHCNMKFSIDEAERSETLADLVRALERFGGYGPLVREYTGAFATRHLGPIAPAKRLRIVRDLARLWESGIFQVQGKRYKIDKAGIAAGMKTVCDLEKYGFKNHNYLKRILLAKAERISAEGLTAREERQKIESQKVRRSEGVGQAFQPAETLSPEAQVEFKKKLGVSKFSELIGKKK